MEQVVSALVAQGPLGIALLAVGFLFWKQSGELKEVQAARVEDAKKTVTILLELVDKQHGALEEFTKAFIELKSAVVERRRV